MINIHCYDFPSARIKPKDGVRGMNKPSLTIRPESTGPEEKKEPLLQIILDEEHGVPKVIYKGEEIKRNREILLHWETDTEYMGGLTYLIEHVEPGCIVNRIERRVKGHACD